jgi:hypothetical protein
MINYEKVAEKIFAIIKGQNHDVVMFTNDGAETSDPAEARRFFIREPNYMVTLDEENKDVKINKNKNIPLEAFQGLAEQLKKLAQTYMLNTQIRVFGQEIKPKDYAYQAKRYKDKDTMSNVLEAEVPVWLVNVPANIYAGKYYDFRTVRVKVPMSIAATEQDAIDWVNNNKEEVLRGIDSKRAYGGKRYVASPVEKNVFFKNDYHVMPSKVLVSEASLSRPYGSKKTSYQTLESVKVIVRHRKPVDEEVRGSRSRAIKAIFIERAGERFRFPHNYLTGARAMARHMNEGGEMTDTVGQYIIEKTGNLLKLKEFYQYVTRNKLINEASEDIISIVKENALTIKNELHRLQGLKTYGSVKERIEAQQANVIEEAGADDLKELFTVKKFDEGIGEILPLVNRLVSEKKAWRASIQEASGKPFTVVRTQDLQEEDVMIVGDPMQRVGYKLQGLVKRVAEESDLSRFVGYVAGKLVEGSTLNAFEKGIVKNVLGNVQIVETDEYNKPFEWKYPDKPEGVLKLSKGQLADMRKSAKDHNARLDKSYKKKVKEETEDDDDDDGTGGKFRDEWGRDTEEQDEWKKNITGKKNKKVDEAYDAKREVDAYNASHEEEVERKKNRDRLNPPGEKRKPDQHQMNVDHDKWMMGEEIGNDVPPEILQKAQQVSKEHRCVQHVERTEDGGYRISDWYDCDNTVASYENGRLKESVIDKMTESFNEKLSEFVDLKKLF